ncbi:hypothetical protein NE237_005017 [Protea cynaroides]|uniref:Uncharacterized protein n=1 Tax=Protea cynaroides TaxID=273540 RepID=A0A9Q0KJU0_9MAGN|nr:hypothetical protein NE237_005017 [Protea cynaroides]
MTAAAGGSLPPVDGNGNRGGKGYGRGAGNVAPLPIRSSVENLRGDNSYRFKAGTSVNARSESRFAKENESVGLNDVLAKGVNHNGPFPATDLTESRVPMINPFLGCLESNSYPNDAGLGSGSQNDISRTSFPPPVVATSLGIGPQSQLQMNNPFLLRGVFSLPATHVMTDAQYGTGALPVVVDERRGLPWETNGNKGERPANKERQLGHSGLRDQNASTKPVGRWADIVDDEESEEGDVVAMEEREALPVVYNDLEAVDGALKDKEGEFTMVDKLLLRHPLGIGNKKVSQGRADQSNAVEARLARLETL